MEQQPTEQQPSDQYLIELLQSRAIEVELVQGVLEKLSILRRMHSDLHQLIQVITPCPPIVKVPHEIDSFSS